MAFLENRDKGRTKEQPTAAVVSLPKGGGAIRGIGEKFGANPVTGTGSMTVPIATSPGRSGFGPQLALSYDSGSGNGPFGFGWSLSIPSITRKTDKGLPQYLDSEESDVFVLSGAEDLVPAFKPNTVQVDEIERDGCMVRCYRPRIEGLFARIERWTNLQSRETHWRSISRDNITTWYGKTAESRIADPADPLRVFSWLICQSYDDKGNAIVYEYKEEDSERIDLSKVHEKNRTTQGRRAGRYLKRVKYGNRRPNRDADTWQASDPSQLPNDTWMFEVVFDYGEGHYLEDTPDAEERIFARARIDPPAESHWPVRPDPFSSYRSGFEVRTYRLCQRVLMFHHFPDELGTPDYLVRSTEFTYSASPIASFITQVTQSGYVHRPDGTYLKKSLPPLGFEYSKAVIHGEIETIDPESLQNLPVGVSGVHYQWLDMDGEGLQGILYAEQEDWYYKRNLSPISVVKDHGREKIVARFEPLTRIATQPSIVKGADAQYQFLDLAGDGNLDLVRFEKPISGFFERTQDERWENLIPFRSAPNVQWNDPNLRFVDLTGDGHADILITEDGALTWYPSMAEEGFGTGIRVPTPRDEEEGPALVFADGTQTIYAADLSGDGLSDIVRIRNGEVCYWPNLGYGRFGSKVTMDHAPWFDTPDQFDPRRIRVADIDGSGTTDIIYLERSRVAIYRNECGNGWGPAEYLSSFPPVDDLSSVTAVDLLGNGTACLVWSSPLPSNFGRPMHYIDLMGGQKPHLLVKTINNLGSETRVQYTPSTKFYLLDEYAGKPWITRLPFPVQVVERVDTCDHISRNRFVTRYAYHHGYFDGEEREFRGFGMVEQFDTEELGALTESGDFPNADNIDKASYVPTVLTKTWFHTGVYLGRDHVSDFFAGLLDANDIGEYYREPGLTDTQARALLLDDTVLPDGLPVDEEREACRALRGAMLRQEIYALDGTDKERHPYNVTEQNFTIRPLQPQAGNRHAVFFTHAREAINYQYERNPTDPRIAHALTLEVDEFGNVLKSAAIGYGRHQPDMSLSAEDRAKQTHTLITYTENSVTNAIDTADDHGTPLPCETRTFELTGLVLPAGRSRFTFDEVSSAGTGAVPIAYEQNPVSGVLQNRLIEHVRTYYRRNDLTGALHLGELQSLALPFESCKLAFTSGLAVQIYADSGKLTPTALNNVLLNEGKYVHSEGDADWWIPSGRIFFSATAAIADPAVTAVEELAEARQHFFLPRKFTDPFGHSSAVDYDTHDFLVVKTEDALGNTVTAGNDYRVLQPKQMTDPNGNRGETAFDTLGMVVGTAVMGKPLPAPVEGDSLDGFEADLTDAVILDHLANPLIDPHAILQRATTRLVYDLFAYHRTKDQPDPQPAAVYTLVREIHDADPGGGQTRIQHSFSYSDGFGREIQKKVQAEAGPVPERDVEGIIIVGPDGRPEMTPNDLSPRWVGSGWTVFNNKAKPVRWYEPFFTDTHRFEFDVRIGVSPVLFYDPVQRMVATLHPNHTWEKVVFDPWRQETWDVNDTVLVADPKTDADVGVFFRRLSDVEYLPAWHGLRTDPAHAAGFTERYPDSTVRTNETKAATKTQAHAATPSTAYFDTLGRPFLTVAHNKVVCPGHDLDGSEDKFHARVDLDIEGNQLEVRDAIVHNGDTQGRAVMRYDYDMLSTRIHQSGMEAGKRWILNNVAGQPIYAWDGRDHLFRTVYDQLRRPIESYLREGSGPELLVGRIVYGETQPSPEATNQRGKVVQLFDQAGVVTSDEYDFKGNLLGGRRRLAREYKTTLNWSAAVPLEADIFTSRTRYDVLNRPTELTTPHTPAMQPSVIRPTYNEANLLERVEANLRSATVATPFVTDIDYDAKGQRTRIDHGNGIRTTYEYDPLTFRLNRLQTMRGAEPMQDLRYTYDPGGNITHIRDDAQQTIFFRNRRVEPNAEYTYDAIYRLIEATGREHLGQTGAQLNPPTAPDAFNRFHARLDHPGDGNVMGTYVECYIYDAVGNFLATQHRGSDPAHPGWTRDYAYSEPSLLEPVKTSNRLSRTTLEMQNGQPVVEPYAYDAHGNITSMPHLPMMRLDFQDQLQATSKQVVSNGGTPEITDYVYDAAGQRVRKVTERQAAVGQTPTRMKERIYLGGFEIYRRYQSDGETVERERETLHVMVDQQRIALVEMRTLDTAGDDPSPPQLIRYQFGNHLGSASLELDDQAQIIFYEEYYPYGSTSYQAGRSAVEVGLKRYRYTGKERDDENGLHYYGARYYASWLGRWTAADPVGIRDGINVYAYVGNNPVRKVDQIGRQGADTVDDFSVHGKKGGREIRFTMDIDEPLPVGERGLPLAEARARALDVNNRQFLDSATNRFTKYLGTEMRPTQLGTSTVSIVNDPYALITKRFGEVAEMRMIFQDAVARIKNPMRLRPTELKNTINSNMWDIIKYGGSESAIRIRAALDRIGFENVPSVGYALKRPPTAPSGSPSAVGLGTKGVALAATALVVFGPGTVREKAQMLAVDIGTDFIATRVVGAQLARILSLPLAVVIGMCSDQAGACEAQARAEARQALLDKINERAWAIFYSELGAGNRPEWDFAYGQAVHEKYVELGQDKADEAQRKMLRDQDPNVCTNASPLPNLNNTVPILNNTAPRMYAR